MDSRQYYQLCVQADMMMNRGYFKPSALTIIKNSFFLHDPIIAFLQLLRKCEYYSKGKSVWERFAFRLFRVRYNRISMKLGFSISLNVLGPGCLIPHWGTIVIGSGNTIGKYSVIHTSTCITAGKKTIGDGFYLSTGAKVARDIVVANNVSVGANSLLNKPVTESNCVVAGMPAKIIKQSEAWYIRDGKEYTRRFHECERLEERMRQ